MLDILVSLLNAVIAGGSDFFALVADVIGGSSTAAPVVAE